MKIMTSKNNNLYKSITDIKNNDLIENIILEIMKDIENHNIIYQKEAQFQFDLAWRINEKIDKNSGLKIFLEFYSMSDNEIKNNKSKLKKFSTDIIILDKCGNYIPIELKYKKQGMKTFDNYGERKIGYDGAEDFGKFDYLWDIHRIEKLKNNNNITKQPPLDKGTFICGYAIMITDAHLYWTKGNGIADKMTLNKELVEISWKTPTTKSKGKLCDSITEEKGRNHSLYYAPLIENKKLIDDDQIHKIEKRHMPLSKTYNFLGNGNKTSIQNNIAIISTENTEIITIKDYKCYVYNSNKKEYNENQEHIEIKAFIAKI